MMYGCFSCSERYTSKFCYRGLRTHVVSVRTAFGTLSAVACSVQGHKEAFSHHFFGAGQAEVMEHGIHTNFNFSITSKSVLT